MRAAIISILALPVLVWAASQPPSTSPGTSSAPPETPATLLDPAPPAACLAPPSARRRRLPACVYVCEPARTTNYNRDEVEARRIGRRWANNLENGLEPMEGWRGFEGPQPGGGFGELETGQMDINSVLEDMREGRVDGNGDAELNSLEVEATQERLTAGGLDGGGYADFLAGIEAPVRPVQRTLAGTIQGAVSNGLPDGSIPLLLAAVVMLARAAGLGSRNNAARGAVEGEGKVVDRLRRL